jgi:hypothetical protein
LLLSRTQICTVQLANEKLAACEWSITSLNYGTRRNRGNMPPFRCEPTEGVLEAGQKLNVRVVFQPTPRVDAPYTEELTFRIKHSKQQKTIRCVGVGVTPRVEFGPTAADIGAILPMFEGQTANETIVAITNPCDYPVELVCTDLDPSHVASLAVLQRVTGYDENGNLYMPPRGPGEPFFPELVEEAERAARIEAATLAAAAAAAAAEAAAAAALLAPMDVDGAAPAGDVPPTRTPPPGGVAGSVVNAGSAAGAGSQVGDLMDVEPLPTPTPPSEVPVSVESPFRAVVYGPPGANATAQARLLGKRYGLPVVTIDDLIGQAPPELKPVNRGPPPAEASDMSTKSGKRVPQLGPKSLKSIGKTVALGVTTGNLAAQDASWVAEYGPDFVAAVRAALVEVLTDPIYARGVVIAGLRSTVLRAADAASCLITALGLGPPVPPAPPVLAEGEIPPTPPPPPPPPVTDACIYAGAHRALAFEMTIDRATAMARSTTTEEGASTGPAAQRAETRFGQLWDAYARELPALAKLLAGSSLGATDTMLLHRTVDATPTPLERVHRDIVGFRFDGRKLEMTLPRTEDDFFFVPDPYEMQVLQRPRAPAKLRQLPKLVLLTAVLPMPEPTAEVSALSVKGAKGAKGKAAPAKPPPPPPPPVVKAAPAGTAPPPADVTYLEETRWVVPARSTMHIALRFQTEELGRYDEVLTFEVSAGDKIKLPITAVCDYPRIATDARSLFYKRSKARPAVPLINRQFITSLGVFDFGPVLAANDNAGYLEGRKPDHMARFRISNAGHFPLNATFLLKSSLVPPPPPPDPKAKPAKGEPPPPPPPPTIFYLSPAALSLKLEETAELALFAFPAAEETYEDAVIVRIEDNPNEFEFPITVTGAKPAFRVLLDTDVDAGPSGAPPPPADPAAPPPASHTIAFERLLLGCKDARAFVVENTGILPLRWKLAGAEKLEKDFKELAVFPLSGELAAKTSARVSVEFTSLVKRALECELRVEVTDASTLPPVVKGAKAPPPAAASIVQTFPVKIAAEGYNIDVKPRWPNLKYPGIDFGTVRVQESKAEVLVIPNGGKYPVDFKFNLKTGTVRRLFTFEPDAGSIPPGGSASVNVTFNGALALSDEVTLQHNSDVSLTVIEPLTGERFQNPVPVKLSVRAVFSRYGLTPARGLNFGPVEFQVASRPRIFEIANLGEFPFEWDLVSLFSSGAKSRPESAVKRPSTSKGKDAKGGKGGKAEAPAPEAPAFGPYEITPTKGTISPGQRQEVTVNFIAAGNEAYREILGIKISGKDPADHPEGVPYEIVGESCVPGIVADSVNSIFEEVLVMPALDPFNPRDREFGLSERLFAFGGVIANLDGKEAYASSTNLKFTNPFKIPCTVRFTVKPQGTFPANLPFPISVEPAQLVIPPSEYRYTCLKFAPTAIQQFAASFEAVVDNGQDAATRTFGCELRGEGTLPSLTLQDPGLDAQGRPTIKFPRTAKGRGASFNIVVKNNGVLAATGHLELVKDDGGAYALVGGRQSFKVAPKKSASFAVTFKPREARAYNEGALRLVVDNNPFETYAIGAVGEGYQDEIGFEELPHGEVDTLLLGDTQVGKPLVVRFLLRNNVPDKYYRFKWSDSASVKFTPSSGHIAPASTRAITATYGATRAERLEPLAVAVDPKGALLLGRWMHHALRSHPFPPAAAAAASLSG